MKAQIKVTNEDKFYEVDDISVENTKIHSSKDYCYGSITVNDTTTTGTFSADEFEEEFGFILL